MFAVFFASSYATFVSLSGGHAPPVSASGVHAKVTISHNLLSRQIRLNCPSFAIQILLAPSLRAPKEQTALIPPCTRSQSSRNQAVRVHKDKRN